MEVRACGADDEGIRTGANGNVSLEESASRVYLPDSFSFSLRVEELILRGPTARQPTRKFANAKMH